MDIRLPIPSKRFVPFHPRVAHLFANAFEMLRVLQEVRGDRHVVVARLVVHLVSASEQVETYFQADDT